jgi:Glycosyltransferase family 92
LQLGVAVIIRNEAPYLDEWLAYHHALGVQHFFIYDNSSDDELYGVLERWINHGLVTLTYWPLPGGQIDAYSHALRFFGPSLDWLAFFDVDEFVVPLVDDDMPSLLARWPDAADVRMPRVDFGFSGHRAPPTGLSIEAYTERADVFGRDPSKPPRVKTVVQPRGISAVGIHTATVADAPLSADGRPVPTETIGKACHPFVQLNHYYTRSFEEFEAKRFRGSGTGRIARPAIPFDLPSLGTDIAALRFADRTRSMLERMRSLSASPYRYGSESAIAQLPRFNDLGLFTEFAIANTVLEEPEQVREPRLRIENEYGGIGFVGDIGGQDHVVRRRELSGSMHLEPLLVRCRGRVDASWGDDAFEVEDSLRRGAVTASDDGWQVAPADGELASFIELDPAGQRRVQALGFVISTRGRTRLAAGLERLDGSTTEPLELELAAASTYAGVVELDASPDLTTRVVVRLGLPQGGAVVHDLFIITYG